MPDDELLIALYVPVCIRIIDARTLREVAGRGVDWEAFRPVSAGHLVAEMGFILDREAAPLAGWRPVGTGGCYVGCIERRAAPGETLSPDSILNAAVRAADRAERARTACQISPETRWCSTHATYHDHALL